MYSGKQPAPPAPDRPRILNFNRNMEFGNGITQKFLFDHCMVFGHLESPHLPRKDHARLIKMLKPPKPTKKTRTAQDIFLKVILFYRSSASPDNITTK